MDITKLKNDKERTAFLEDYRNTENGWILWKELTDIRRRWWLYVLGDCSLIVEEQEQEFAWPNIHKAWRPMQWYIVKAPLHEVPLANQQASRTLALAALKRVQKEARK